jgi:hypothetical protein
MYGFPGFGRRAAHDQARLDKHIEAAEAQWEGQ